MINVAPRDLLREFLDIVTCDGWPVACQTPRPVSNLIAGAPACERGISTLDAHLAGMNDAAPPAPPAPPASPLILALGDSLTSGHGLKRHESFAAQLELRLRAVYPQAGVINAGLPGDTSAGALRRLPDLLSSLRQRPHLALVELGANDVLRRNPATQLKANLATIIEELSRCGIPSLLLTVEPPPFLGHLLGDYSTVYTAVAAKFGLKTCPFFPDGVLGHPAMVLADRVHPNARAVSLCAAGVLPHVLAALDVETLRAA
jgi:acyl-CoA thioesterase-1